MKRLLAMLCVFWLLGMAPAIAHAQSCSASASGVNFGNVSPISGNAVAATETISVTCTWPSISLTPYAQVCLNLGGTSPRYLTNGTNQLRYDLFQDAGHSIAWGSIYNGTTPIALTMTKPASGTTLTENVTIYGQIAAAQPTVPTVNNASTVYSQSFGGNQTSLNYAFYLLLPSGCAGLTSSSGTFPFNASATVVNNCDITATGVAFGSAGVLSNALSATGSISAQCTNGDAWRISLNGGASGNVVARAMKRSGGGGSVGYQLYTDAGHSTAWGDGTSGTTMATGAGTGNAQTVTVYGVVPAQTTPAPGNYSDTITATISF